MRLTTPRGRKIISYLFVFLAGALFAVLTLEARIWQYHQGQAAELVAEADAAADAEHTAAVAKVREITSRLDAATGSQPLSHDQAADRARANGAEAMKLAMKAKPGERYK